MIEYRITKSDDRILHQMGLNNWQLISISEGKMYWSKKKVQRKSVKEIKDTNEWLEFRDLYKTIKNNGLSNATLKDNYNKLVEQWLHETVMWNLVEYKKYLEVKKKKEFALMASTYINQARYKDDWDIIEDLSRKFINDIFKEKDLNSDEIDNITTEISAYELKHKREVTDWVVRNMIELLLNK